MNTSVFGRDSPTASITGLAELQRDRPVAAREVVVLEERRRRQHDVGIHRGVGEHLIEDHREEILALEAANDAALIGQDRDRDCSCRRTAR